ncbi:galactoside 2-alpha-L-fucosyltransferase 3 [Aplysia californica]|uniref:L-Fucosyltransferase n=1 Tax=Aplysia californica TaxID=6500 RepID=A0ABM1W152_APLCA|nr:galactoside 2-alpha-L-fucosyltransferase 3 [Aplysia californica]
MAESRIFTFLVLTYAIIVTVIIIYDRTVGRTAFALKVQPQSLVSEVNWEAVQAKNVSKPANHSSDESTQRPTEDTLKVNETRQKVEKEKESTGNCPLFVSTGLNGRLGNQMFEYAATVGVARSQGRIPALLTRTSDMQNAFQITHARTFNTSHGCDSWQAVSDKHFGIFEIGLTKLPKKNTTLSGYRQSWKYFESAQDELRKEFTFKDNITADAKKLEAEIRRNFPNRTDDLKWCAANIKRPDVHVLSSASPQLHLAFLARTSHAVISAGTYSWWAGWLTGGKVIYFSGYPGNGTFLMNDFKAADYYPPHWIGIGE